MIHTDIDTPRKYVKMKKEVYEHLAQTFLVKKKKKKFKNRDLWFFAVLIISFCFLIIFILSTFLAKKDSYSQSIFVIQDKTPVEIGFDFSAMGDNKVRALAFNLNSLNLEGYDALSLSLRNKEISKDKSAVKVQLENVLNEKDSQYVSGINSKWQSFTLPLSSFTKISDWSSAKSLTFIVEEWNIGNKKDIIYIDEVKFTAKKIKK